MEMMLQKYLYINFNCILILEKCVCIEDFLYFEIMFYEWKFR